MANLLLVNAAELLRRPGSEKRLTLQPTITELAIDDTRFGAADPVDVELRLESLTDGIVVDGMVSVPWHDTCRRCLKPVGGVVDGEIHELYQNVVTDPEAFEIVGDQLDLVPMVREVLLLDVPAAPLCRPGCAGLCASCGADLNDGPCGCSAPAADPRWAVLDQLKGGDASDDQVG